MRHGTSVISKAHSHIVDLNRLGLKRYELCRLADDQSPTGRWTLQSTSHRQQAAGSPVVSAESCLSPSGRPVTATKLLGPWSCQLSPACPRAVDQSPPANCSVPGRVSWVLRVPERWTSTWHRLAAFTEQWPNRILRIISLQPTTRHLRWFKAVKRVRIAIGARSLASYNLLRRGTVCCLLCVTRSTRQMETYHFRHWLTPSAAPLRPLWRYLLICFQVCFSIAQL